MVLRAECQGGGMRRRSVPLQTLLQGWETGGTASRTHMSDSKSRSPQVFERCVPHLRDAGVACSHGEGVVVEGARVAQGALG